MDRIIFHIDVNSAYLSWEAVDRLQHGDSVDLREIAAVVGGNEASRHGIVLAKSIPAKRYNIQTGESLYAARQKCPNLVTVPPRYELYMRCSNAMRTLLAEYSDSIQVFSVDECFLDFTTMASRLGDPVTVADEIRKRCREELGFTVNIGISSNKLLAKVAGDLKKPDKTLTLFPEEIPDKLWPLPVEDLYMVGRATAPKLHQMGILTIGDLAKTDPALLKYRFKSFGRILWDYANGIESSSVRPTGPAIKGMGNSTTIAFDVEDRTTAHLVLLSLTETVAARLRQGGWCARLVSVSLKSSEFTRCSHQRVLPAPTDCTNTLFTAAQTLFDEVWDGSPLRHLGIRTTDLHPAQSLQLSLFQQDTPKMQALDTTIDTLRQRFGNRSLIRGSFLNTKLKPVAGGVIEDDYQMIFAPHYSID